jgi:hypothetical protein
MKSRVNILILALICVATLGAPTFSHAQSINLALDQINISTSPEIPAPGQSVTVSLESYSTDLNAASIVWLVDGKNVSQGIGKTSIELKAPQLGRTTNVVAAIMTAEGREVRKTVVLKPGSVDMIWESSGFIPPFYRGKAHLAYQNEVKVTAVPHITGNNGAEIDPTTLLYKWKRNDRVIQDQSGYGKQTFTFQDSLPQDSAIEVEVSTRTGEGKARGSLSLSPLEPSLSLYQEDPLYGVLYNIALFNTINLTNQEITLRAVPYSFNTSSKRPLTYIWSVNNLERNDLSTNESIILRTKGDVAGSSSIGLEVKSSGNILQRARAAVDVGFTKKQEADVTFQ